MPSELKEKYLFVRNSFSTRFKRDNWSFYRLYILITTKAGQKKILNFVRKIIRFLYITVFRIKKSTQRDYLLWIKRNYPNKKKIEIYKKESLTFSFQPKVSVLLSIVNGPLHLLIQSVDSVQKQIYTNWELCVLCPSNLDNLKEYLNELTNDKRIKVIFNDQPSTNLNTLLNNSTGEYIAVLSCNDALSPDALFQNIKVLNTDNSIDFIYSDEDIINQSGVFTEPFFKPDWCPESFLSRNYIGNLIFVKQKIAIEIGGFRDEFKNNTLYDFLLRLTETTAKINHIAKILYHQSDYETLKLIDNTAISSDTDTGVKALSDALARRKIKGKVSVVANEKDIYEIRYEVLEYKKVTIIIPSKDKAELCEVSISSVFERTDYPDYEILFINNNSTEQSFFDMIKKWETKEPARFTCIDDNEPFNFSRLMNKCARAAKGDYFLLLNNDIEVLHADWMTAMVEQAQFKTIGAVGAKLFYPNNTIQHAGVITGLGGISGHAFVGFQRDAPGYHHFLKCVNNFSAVTAACMMVRKDVYFEVGGFEERLVIDFNDIDFCLKLLEKGYRNIYLPHVQLYHYESTSRGHPLKTRKSYHRHIMDIGYFKARWQKYIDYDPCYSPHLSKVSNNYSLNVRD